jgi:hypothetical protein
VRPPANREIRQKPGSNTTSTAHREAAAHAVMEHCCRAGATPAWRKECPSRAAADWCSGDRANQHVRGKSPPWPQPADAGSHQSTWATPQKAEVFEGRWSPRPAAAGFFQGLLALVTPARQVRAGEAQPGCPRKGLAPSTARHPPRRGIAAARLQASLPSPLGCHCRECIP